MLPNRELTPDEIRSALRGCTQVKALETGLVPLRFPDSAIDYYRQDAQWHLRALSPAGVRLEFHTDSPSVEIDFAVTAFDRAYAYADLLVNDTFVSSLGATEKPRRISGVLPTHCAGAEQRQLTIYLPQCVNIEICNVTLAPGSSFSPGDKRPLLLALGDSITQGMDSFHPSATYVATAARELGMNLHNCSIGGFHFDAASLPEPPAADPELVLVAYGVNDWHGNRDVAAARPYLERLHELLVNTPIVVLEPIWYERDEGEAEKNANGIRLAEYRLALAAIVSDFDNTTYIPARSLFPSGTAMMPDGVHPDTAGHSVYGRQLAAQLRSTARGL